MDVAIEAAGSQDLAFARNGLRARTDDDVDIGLRVRVARLADRRNAPVLQPDIGLVDAGMIDHQRVGDHALSLYAVADLAG